MACPTTARPPSANTRRARFLANLMEDSFGGSGSDDSDNEDNQLLISFRRPRRPGSASVSSPSQRTVRPRRNASVRTRGVKEKRGTLKRAAAQDGGSSSSSQASNSGPSTSGSCRPKRSKVTNRQTSANISRESTSSPPAPHSGEAPSPGVGDSRRSDLVRPATILLSDLLAEFHVRDFERSNNREQIPTGINNANGIPSRSEDLRTVVSSSGYDSHIDAGESSGGSPDTGSGSSEVQQGMAALDIVDAIEEPNPDRSLPPSTNPLLHQFTRQQAGSSIRAGVSERRTPTRPSRLLLDRLLNLSASLVDLDPPSPLPPDLTLRSDPSTPEDLNTARNFELDDIDGVPLRGGTEPRQGGLGRSGSLPASDRARRSSSLVAIGRTDNRAASSAENSDVHVFLDRIDGVPLSGRTEPRSGGWLSRAASAGSEDLIDISVESPIPGPSGATTSDNDVEVLGVEVSPGTMARIHQLEVDEAMARRLQEEEDGMDSSPTPLTVPSRTRLRRRPPTRRGTDASTATGDNSDVRVILPRLEQLADIVHTMMEDETGDEAAGSAGDVDEPGPATRAPTHQSTRNSQRMRRARQRRPMPGAAYGRPQDVSLTSFLDRMASSTFENSRLDYEALMDLVERIGDAGPAGLSRREIGRLPTTKYTGLEDNEMTSCTICMSDFAANERLRLLPCTHTFHTGCIDRWLEQRSNCPICRSGVREHVVAGHN